jgi:antitoxin component YwqK of YwqJK toxin-antitoxin module
MCDKKLIVRTFESFLKKEIEPEDVSKDEPVLPNELMSLIAFHSPDLQTFYKLVTTHRVFGITETEKVTLIDRFVKPFEKEKQKNTKRCTVYGQILPNGLKHGRIQKVSEKGDIVCEYTCVAGKKEGRYVKWFEDQKNKNGERVIKTERFYSQGKPDGTWTEWYGENVKRRTETFNKGEKVNVYIWYFNGAPCMRKNYVNGKKDGEWTTLYDNGVLHQKRFYVQGKRDGLTETYLENGWIIKKGYHKEGKKDGLWRDYNDNRTKSQVRRYVNGKKHGVCKTWYDNGILSTMTHYSNGLMDGKRKEWTLHGKLRLVEHYVKGVKSGKWKKLTREKILKGCTKPEKQLVAFQKPVHETTREKLLYHNLVSYNGDPIVWFMKSAHGHLHSHVIKTMVQKLNSGFYYGSLFWDTDVKNIFRNVMNLISFMPQHDQVPIRKRRKEKLKKKVSEMFKNEAIRIYEIRYMAIVSSVNNIPSKIPPSNAVPRYYCLKGAKPNSLLSAVLYAYSDSYKTLKSNKVGRFMELFCDRLSEFSEGKISKDHSFDIDTCTYIEQMLGVNIIILGSLSNTLEDVMPTWNKIFRGSKTIVLFYSNNTKRYYPLISKKNGLIVDMEKLESNKGMMKAIMKIYRM